MNLKLTVFSHGWVFLAPYQWDDTRSVLSRPIRLGKKTAWIELRQRGKHVSLRWRSDRSLTSADERRVGEKAQYILGCDIDLGPFAEIAKKNNAKVHRFIRDGGGRLLRSEDLFEDAVKTLLTTNASWSFTTQMVSAVCTLPGRLSVPSTAVIGGAGLFPTADEILLFTTKRLERICRLGYRADYLRNVAKHFVGAPTYRSEDRSQILEALRGIKGLGPYSINHLAVLLGDHERMPIDSEVRAFCREHRCLQADKEIEAHYARWSPYQFLGYKCERIVDRSNWLGD